MTPPSQPGIYAVLERLLRATKDPLTAADLFENQDVKNFADSVNRVSDYVGHMWRRGLVQRWTAPPQLNNKTRFAYTWKEGGPTAEPVQDKVKRLPEMRVLKNPLSKPNIRITEEDDRVIIELDEFSITVQSKKPQ